jgi:GAF domain-containing protein
VVQGQWAGVISINWAAPRAFTDTDLRFYQSLAAQAAIVLNNRLLFEQAQKRANREAVINTINQKIQSATSVENALQTAVREIGSLLKVRRAVVQIGAGTPRPGNGQPA